MTKKGLTLVELLAVIVVLGVVLLITVPVITDAVNEARMKTFQDTALGILNTAKQTYIDYTGNKMRVEMSNGLIYLNDEEISKLSYNGKMPKNGYVEISAEGDAKIIIYNENYCAYKINNKDNVKVIEINSTDECSEDALKKLEG